MDTKPQGDPNESATDPASTIRSPVPPEWQFSLRSLLIATTIVSICLALGTYFAGVAFAALVLVVIQAATLLFADWLIRPANRKALAFVTAGSWMIAGSGLLIVGAKVAYGFMDSGAPRDVWLTVVVIVLGCTVCYVFAWWRWRQLTAHRRENL